MSRLRQLAERKAEGRGDDCFSSGRLNREKIKHVMSSVEYADETWQAEEEALDAALALPAVQEGMNERAD